MNTNGLGVEAVERRVSALGEDVVRLHREVYGEGPDMGLRGLHAKVDTLLTRSAILVACVAVMTACMLYLAYMRSQVPL